MEGERLIRLTIAQASSIIAATMGDQRISPQELIGEDAPPSEFMGKSPEEKFTEHLEGLESRASVAMDEWLAELGFADDELQYQDRPRGHR